MMKINKIKRIYLLYPTFLLVVIFIALEIILRIYNPLAPRLKGDQILLPINQKIDIRHVQVKGLDSSIIHTKNSLGFRGPNPPSDLSTDLSILTVGGSTTECLYISDGKTWEDLLNEKLQKHFNKLWLNNAGLDGHSSFGHLILTNNYLAKLHPKVVIYLVGCNDVEAGKIKDNDLNQVGGSAGFKQFLYKHSEVYSTVRSIQKAYQARKAGLTHNMDFDLQHRDTSSIASDSLQHILAHQQNFLTGYALRIDSLIHICLRNGITPVFLTQPSVCGNEPDAATGQPLGNILLDNGMNCDTYWQVLQQYNQVTKETCARNQVLCIDLGGMLPKNSNYFYDSMHYTNEGCEAVASLIAPPLIAYLQQKFPAYSKPNH